MPPRALALAMLAAVTAAGCSSAVTFPAHPVGQEPNLRLYDVDDDGRADVGFARNDAGRVVAMHVLTGMGHRMTVDLDAIDVAHCRHLVILLDGFGYGVVERYYREGGLRPMHPPSRVIAPYPTLTDVCLEDLLGYIPCAGFEAVYYDRAAGRVVGGAMDYLSGTNQPYNRLLHHRTNLVLDAVGYARPWVVFGKELDDTKEVFDNRRTREVRSYLVSTAGISTAGGADAQLRCLREVDRLIHQVLWETRGLTKVTLMGDHGHSYTPPRRIDLEGHLTARHWRLVDRLREPRDVAYIRFGLETYASFACDQPLALAKDLVEAQGVELASVAVGDEVVVLAPDGRRARVFHRDGRFGYAAEAGDPLKLVEVLASLTVDDHDTYDAGDLLAATWRRVYPAPLQRLWRAHFALVDNPPDVIVSLADGYYSGSRSLDAFVDVVSTHGSLNRRNSTTFIMSSIAPLPPVLRSRDVPAAMESALNADHWPLRE